MDDREILFRGLTIFNNRFIDGLLVDEDPPAIKDVYGHIHPVRKNTVGQYTGKCDKKGIKIYEGDIILIDSKNYLVMYYDTTFLLFRNHEPSNFLFLYRSFELEIVGNLIEDPDLRF